MSNVYQPIIGLEIHVELATKSKMFCQCDAAWQQYEPNANTCPVCLGLPGALPVPNKAAVEHTIKIAQALGCSINKHSHFDRKHYFYPDLPKGYQISQYDEPIGVNGEVKLTYHNISTKQFETKSFRIHRVHLEEDTGKLIHAGKESHVNFNRSSVPLVEIVTEADFRSSEEVKAFLQELHTIIRYLGVSEADMEKGSMRLEPNISVLLTQDGGSAGRIEPKDLPKFKVEVKNINSFNFVKKAVDYEVKRQSELLEKGETPAQETRGWDEKKNVTVAQRSKEDAHDYRYFPEPDVPPMEFSDELLERIRATIPELPSEKAERYVKEFGLKLSDAIQITREQGIAEYFEKVISTSKSQVPSQTIANLIINKKVSTDLQVHEFVEQAIELSKPKATDMGKLDEVVQAVLKANEKSVADYKSGKTNTLMFLVGQVMREMKGQADAQAVKDALTRALE
ncbi:Asp-tRNA(Asn)/Glu-tRNA(Gln) amidotransferase subunit GatB [Candidatus Woesebacteria bacterium]|nr:Asp-tRNA(Asn)/Glu-tRNA(Gln) amidotransferase subunit GatB [Candidatus Woesebacteria bacterium]